MRVIRAIVTFGLLGVLMTGSVDARPAPAPTTPAQCMASPAVNTVTCAIYQEFSSTGNPIFSPNNVIIQQGSAHTFQLVWIDQNGFHTTTSDPGQAYSWDSGAMSTTSNSHFPVNFTGATGTVSYHCSFHQGQGMTGTIVIEGPTASPLLSFHVQRTLGRVQASWRVATTSGLVGFRLFAGRRLLTPRLIAVRANEHTYHGVASLPEGSGISLQILHTNGRIDTAGPYSVR